MTLQKQQPSGRLVPFMFDNIPVRGLALRLDDLSNYIPSLDTHNLVIGKSLSEMLAASATLASDLKEAQDITLQIHSKSDVPLLVAQCSQDGSLRAFAEYEEDISEVTFKDIADQNALFAVTVKNDKKGKDVYQSFVHLDSKSVSSSIESYFNDSVQLPSYFRVYTDIVDGKMACGAIFLQQMPGEENDGDDWARIGMLINTIKAEEILPGKIKIEELLFRLFSEQDQVRSFPSRPLTFTNKDIRERMKSALKSLGVATCKEIIKEDEIITLTDEFTGQEHSFTASDLKKIFGSQWDEKNSS